MKSNKNTGVQRYEYIGPVSYYMEERPDGEYVSYYDFEIAIQALRKIANEDYRGNRPQSAVDAYNTLKELNEIE